MFNSFWNRIADKYKHHPSSPPIPPSSIFIILPPLITPHQPLPSMTRAHIVYQLSYFSIRNQLNIKRIIFFNNNQFLISLPELRGF